MNSIYLIYNKHTGEIKERVHSFKEALHAAHGDLRIWEKEYYDSY